MAYLMGIDVSTTGAKALLIDERGAVAAAATTEYPLSTPRPLWSEKARHTAQPFWRERAQEFIQAWRMRYPRRCESPIVSFRSRIM